MKPLYNPAKSYFDDWRRNHTNYGQFVAFETGEIVMPSCGEIGPGSRGRRDTKLNIEFDASTDPIRRTTAYFTPDGEPLKRAWLHPGGIQTFLLDWCTETAVAIHVRGAHASRRAQHPPSEAQWAIVPRQFRDRVTVYWPSAGEQPVGMPVCIWSPRKLTADERDHIRTVTAACKAWVEIESGTSPAAFYVRVYGDESKRLNTSSDWAARRMAEKGINASRLLKTTFADMSEYDRVRTAIKVEGATEVRAFTHLKIKQME